MFLKSMFITKCLKSAKLPFLLKRGGVDGHIDIFMDTSILYFSPAEFYISQVPLAIVSPDLG